MGEGNFSLLGGASQQHIATNAERAHEISQPTAVYASDLLLPVFMFSTTAIEHGIRHSDSSPHQADVIRMRGAGEKFVLVKTYVGPKATPAQKIVQHWLRVENTKDSSIYIGVSSTDADNIAVPRKDIHNHIPGLWMVGPTVIGQYTKMEGQETIAFQQGLIGISFDSKEGVLSLYDESGAPIAVRHLFVPHGVSQVFSISVLLGGVYDRVRFVRDAQDLNSAYESCKLWLMGGCHRMALSIQEHQETGRGCKYGHIPKKSMAFLFNTLRNQISLNQQTERMHEEEITAEVTRARDCLTAAGAMGPDAQYDGVEDWCLTLIKAGDFVPSHERNLILQRLWQLYARDLVDVRVVASVVKHLSILANLDAQSSHQNDAQKATKQGKPWPFAHGSVARWGCATALLMWLQTFRCNDPLWVKMGKEIDVMQIARLLRNVVPVALRQSAESVFVHVQRELDDGRTSPSQLAHQPFN